MFTRDPKAREGIENLEKLLESLKRRLDGLEIEWENVLATLKTRMRAIAVSARRQEAAVDKLTPQETDPAENGTAQGAAAGAVSDRAAEINARILARRNRLTMRPPQ